MIPPLAAERSGASYPLRIHLIFSFPDESSSANSVVCTPTQFWRRPTENLRRPWARKRGSWPGRASEPGRPSPQPRECQAPTFRPAPTLGKRVCGASGRKP